jgi:hypothetical protein
MKNSCIRHPENSRFIKRHDWQIKAILTAEGTKAKRTDCAFVGSEILSVMEFYHDNWLANRHMANLRGRYPQSVDIPLDGWLPYSVSYLEELLLGSASPNSIRKTMDLLVSMGFVSKAVPKDITDAYPSNVMWFRLEVNTINKWIDDNWPKPWNPKAKRVTPVPRPIPDLDMPMSDPEPEPEPEIPEVPTAPAENPVSKAASVLFMYYKHVHAKNGNFVFDSSRKTKVTTRLKENRTLGQCAQAILGNRLSPFHQGHHVENDLSKGGKLFDDIELIFRNAKNFEQHMYYATKENVTEDMALADLRRFLAGNPSQYAKALPETPQNGSTGKPEAPQDRRPLQIYRNFARQIAAFFTSFTPVADILELCVTQKGLAEVGEGLTHADKLVEAICDAVLPFRPQGASEAMKLDIEKFAKAFCRTQEVNPEGEKFERPDVEEAPSEPLEDSEV